MTTWSEISVAEAKDLLQKENTILVDVRDSIDYESDHDPRARLLTNSNIAEFINNTSKDSHILVICYHGNRSKMVSGYLSEQGFKRLYSVAGGYEEWKKA